METQTLFRQLSFAPDTDQSTGPSRAAKVRQETQTIFKQASDELDAKGYTRASRLRRETQTILRKANEELQNKEKLAQAAWDAANLAVSAAGKAAEIAANVATVAAQAGVCGCASTRARVCVRFYGLSLSLRMESCVFEARKRECEV